MSMFCSRSASYGITLLMVACGSGDGPMRAVDESAVQTSQPDSDSSGDTESEESTEKEAAEPDEPAPEEPDAVGLPCGLKSLLSTRCQGCHGVDAKNGTPLLTRDNLLSPSKKDPTLTVIERALLRTTAVDKPMPPAGKGDPLNEEELHVLRDWFEHGAEAARCDGDSEK